MYERVRDRIDDIDRKWEKNGREEEMYERGRDREWIDIDRKREKKGGRRKCTKEGERENG
jgi:hypothetical protein